MALQRIYHEISNRGILVDAQRLEEARQYVNVEVAKSLEVIKKVWNCHVYVGTSNDDGSKDSVNLNASSGQRTPLLKLKSLGYKIPTIQKRNEDTGEYESKESLAELTLQRMFASNQFSTPGGDVVIKALLRIRELTTLRNRYIDVRLYYRDGCGYYLSNYNVAGTTTGRRSSRKHTFGFGNNAQNFPSHGAEASIYKRCLVARPGKIFFMVDQIQAEDWPVSALAHNVAALKDLEDGVDRHRKLASLIFNISESKVTTEQRYLGKKTRHARNYGMRGATMSDSLAKEGYSVSSQVCQFLLDTVGKIDPNVEGVFHAYVQQQLYSTRTLTTPFGRERQFFGLRGGDTSGNQKIFREAYSFIPQSTVADNTGFAVYYLEKNGEGCVIQEGHDSIVQEIPDSLDELIEATQKMLYAFDRAIEFHNGITLKIPNEAKISYDFDKTITLKSSTGSKRLVDCTSNDIRNCYERLRNESAIKFTAVAEETVS
jgi:DNA polymerase I-like protein with 3'-5' exonuclease and polymerase domains